MLTGAAVPEVVISCHSASGCVQAVALGLPGGGVADEGVQRVPVEGGLGRAVGSLDGAERALDPGCGGRPLYRRPVLRARAVAVGLGGRVGGERVEREALALVSTVAPPIVVVFRVPAVAAAGLLVLVLLPPLVEDVPDELHAASTAAAAATAGSASSIRRPFRPFSRVSDLIIAFLLRSWTAAGPCAGGR